MTLVTGFFETYQEADKAIRALGVDGFTSQNVSVLGQEAVLSDGHAESSETAETAGKGAGVGGILGLIAGAASFAIPGIGPIIGAGTALGSSLTGAGIGAATGGLIGFFSDLLGHEDHANEAKEAIEKGHIIVMVETGSTHRKLISQILGDYGAYRVFGYVPEVEQADA